MWLILYNFDYFLELFDGVCIIVWMLEIDTVRNTVICCDCLEVMRQLPDKCVDLVLTDPPYGVEGGHGGQTKDYRKADYDGFDDTPEYIKSVCVPAIQECLRIAKTVVLTPGTRCACSYPQPDEIGGFYQPASSRIGKFGFQNLQPIFYYGYYKNAGKGALHTVIVLTESAEKFDHPCPKPINGWTRLLERCSSEGDLVLDPFLGSGTTAVACKRTGRDFVGIEISPAYCETARARILQAETGVTVKEQKQGQKALWT